ncbi:MAG TPA: recombinase family protein [Nitrospiraceae bacterium]|nr:recombinase family protein [Nitrospiraceae bacterium]
MHVALYARYSSERQRESSIADQFRTCERSAQSQGWEVSHRYEDKAVTGSRADRPGYQRLLHDAQAHCFDLLLVEDLSRLTRNEAESIQLRRKLAFWGIRLIGVSDGYDSAAKGHKLQASVRGIINELYLDDLREKTHRGLMGQALKGYSCGGLAYGYRRVPIEDPSKQDEYGRPIITAVRWEPDAEQQNWVRWIFERYAAGSSPRDIAAELNQLGVPSPRGGTWCASAIHGDPTDGTGILCNTRYVGRSIWNRFRWERHPETNRRIKRLRARQEWVEVETPELRIVPEHLWEQVQERMTGRANATLRAACRQAAGRPGRYLLSGLLKCAWCGANYIVADRFRYACASFLNRGEAVCGNRRRIARGVLEQTLLRGIREDLFTEEGFGFFRQEVCRILAQRRKETHTQADKVDSDLQRVNAEIGNLLRALKDGIRTASMQSELERLEADKVRLMAQQNPRPRPLTVEKGLPRLEDQFRTAVENLAKLPGSKIAEARRGLHLLLGGHPITLHPTDDGRLEAEMTGDYAGLVRLMGENKVNNSGCGGRI